MSQTKQLTLLRHAHAEAGLIGQADQDRPLSARGIDEARAAAGWLAARERRAQTVLVSSAKRAQQTWEQVRWAGAPEAQIVPHIYEATPGQLLDILDTASGDDVLLVGHNPGFEELVALLASGVSGDHRGMPPAGIALLQQTADSGWEPAGASLLEFWSP